MSKFLRPAALFALATLLIVLPGLLQLSARHPPARVELRLSPHVPGAGSGSDSKILVPVERSSAKLITRPWLPWPLAVVILRSIPIFAIVYPIWPWVFGRSLNPRLGRWHVALASLPIVVGPILGFLLLPLASALALNAASRTGAFDSDKALSNILLVNACVGFGVAGLWLAGLAVFALNARTTLRPRNEG